MSENKGTYVFNRELIDKRLRELRSTPDIKVSEDLVRKISDLAIEITAIAEIAIVAAPFKPTYADEDVREMARHLNAVIKAYHNDNSQGLPAAQVRDAEGFLRSKKYFNLNQSDLIV